jgi:DNA-binding SARP family transcriptional activator
MMEFRLLGTFEVVDADGRIVDMGRPKQRALLALLLLQANRVVPVAAIIDGGIANAGLVVRVRPTWPR